jgi:hypothetical protein
LIKNSDVKNLNNIHIFAFITYIHLYKLFLNNQAHDDSTLTLDFLLKESFAIYVHLHYLHVHFSKHMRLEYCQFCMNYITRHK